MVSQRARDIEISGIRKMFESAPADAINLGLGEPDFDPPAVVIDALCDAVRHGKNHYGPSAGLPALREAIAERYRALDAEVSRDNVIVTAGGSEGLVASALTLYEDGDEVLIPDPGFVLYAPHARLAGALGVPYPLDEEQGYQPDFDELEKRVTGRTRAIVVNSPSNPTGGVFSPATVDRLVSFAEANGLAIISDEVYEGMVYEGRFTSFWGKSDRVVVVHSFSKMFAMTGWRLGFVVAPRALAPDINKVSYHLIACPSTPAQLAALAGLAHGLDATRAMVKEFRARRSYISRELNRVPGLHCRPPAGAFYTFPKFDWPGTAPEVAGALLKRGLISTPGDAFGARGAGHLRLSFAASRPNLKRAMAILHRYAEEVGAN
ncbi:MAG: aminotransferase class I/II-fold pyridoxal phosphate-dependent enzyme [Thermoplasmata archaeon]|nr:aminotransferase class I/II-fold pyridoxal phosphate-dependent enzyme [Thermoplasmata archaeon]